ncbi:hypothetical protein BC939DRAFT_47479 [Gamsiella multidivaricata]|uniref:uncharacterized protein n=1 Tax=Gamsiella multidivaricata TaxID=101098 RepID=UPI00222073A4|nr:uncharacterized protein BC939DRAFT_47479 [Gamsiella multidivaricata]KAI7828697.1 hypothetical protein BC939DRAFT_47479 [Gamsiella multidivaricata]
MWPSEPLSPPYGSTLPQQQTLHLNNNNVEFSMGQSASQQGYLRPVLNRATSENLRNALYMNSSMDIGERRSPFSDDEPAGTDPGRASPAPLGLLDYRSRQHLAAPLPIRQRSLPDIFRLTPLSHEGGALPTSPFHQPGNKALFLSVSCEADTNSSSPLRLHSIPELHDLYNSQSGGGETVRRRSSFAGYDNGMQENELSDSDDDSSLDQGFLPASLNDLLTAHERQRRQSKQEDAEFRPILLPSPASGSMRDDKDEDEILLSISGSCTDLAGTVQANSRSQFQRSLTELDHADGSISTLALAIPGGQILSYTQQDRSLFEDESQHHMSHKEGSHYKERSTTLDPFCPFPHNAEEVQFAMDDDLATGDVSAEMALSHRANNSDRQGYSVDSSKANTTVATITKELNRAVGSNSRLETQRQQHLLKQHGTMTPISLFALDEEGEGLTSLNGIDFSSLSIVDVGMFSNISSTRQEVGGSALADHISRSNSPLSYAGITKTRTGVSEM